ncbi:hypothetical protein TWF751_004045 [Orbilia oligospora]|nr:hypothetical protein TWF751_004045 [Orbilia oligospora]
MSGTYVLSVKIGARRKEQHSSVLFEAPKTETKNKKKPCFGWVPIRSSKVLGFCGKGCRLKSHVEICYQIIPGPKGFFEFSLLSTPTAFRFNTYVCKALLIGFPFPLLYFAVRGFEERKNPHGCGKGGWGNATRIFDELDAETLPKYQAPHDPPGPGLYFRQVMKIIVIN